MKRSAWLATGVTVGMALGACGDNGGAGHLDDAPPPDGGGFELPPPRVTVTVTLGGMPAAGQIVYFQNHDSTLASESQTNSGGNAAGMVDDGGFVTVLEPIPLGLSSSIPVTQPLATFVGVKPLDHLYIDVSPLVAPGTSITFNLTVPNEQLGNTYALYSSCGTQNIGQGLRAARAGAAVGATLTKAVTLTGCDGMADMLVVSTNGVGQLVGWQYHPNVAVAGGVDVALTGAYLPAVDTTFTYTNTSPASNGLSVQRELRTARGSLYTSSHVTASPNGTMATATLALPAPAGVQAVTTTTDQPNSGIGRQTIVEWGAADASYLVDYAGVALRGYATQPSLDVATHTITWTDAAGDNPDFVLATYRGTHDDGNISHETIWRIAAPYSAYQPGAPSLQLPVLATTTFDFNPKAGDLMSFDRLVTMKAPGGYDAARGRALDTDIPAEITGATGRIVYETLVSSPAVPPLAPTARPGISSNGPSNGPSIGRRLSRGRFTPHAR